MTVNIKPTDLVPVIYEGADGTPKVGWCDRGLEEAMIRQGHWRPPPVGVPISTSVGMEERARFATCSTPPSAVTG